MIYVIYPLQKLHWTLTRKLFREQMAFGWKSMFLLWVVTTNYIGGHFTGLSLSPLRPKVKVDQWNYEVKCYRSQWPSGWKRSGWRINSIQLVADLLPFRHWQTATDNSLIFSSLSLSLSHKNKPFLPSLNTIMAISGHGEIWAGVVTSQGGILHSAVMWDKPRTPTSYLLPPESLFVFVIFGVI